MKERLGKPYAGTRLTKYLEKRILELRSKKTQSVIAAEAGFINPNMLAIIKGGKSKLPLDRVPGLAKALECDPVMLFMMAAEQLGGDTTELAIKQIFGTLVTENEVACQTASKTDPRSASNFDPLCSARRSAFARAELVRVAQPGRTRMVLAA